jgi:hypothetical protein
MKHCIDARATREVAKSVPLKMARCVNMLQPSKELYMPAVRTAAVAAQIGVDRRLLLTPILASKNTALNIKTVISPTCSPEMTNR